MMRARAVPHRPATRWARIAALVLLPLLLVACPSQEGLTITTVDLQVRAEGSGRVTLNGGVLTLPYASSFPHGTDVVLYPEAEAGHAFEGWAGTASGSDNPLTLTLTGAHDVVARFVPQTPPQDDGPGDDGPGDDGPGDGPGDDGPGDDDGPEGAPSWLLSPDAFVMAADLGDTVVLSAAVRNEGDAPGTFSVVSDRTWLSVDPMSGTLAPGAEVVLELSADCPSVGRQLATLTLHGTGASTELTVDRDCRGAAWSPSPGALVFEGSLLAAGDPQPPERTLTLTNDGPGEATPTITSDAAWLAASVAAVPVAPGASTDATVAVTACTEPGQLQGMLTITGGGATASVHVVRDCQSAASFDLAIDRFYLNQAVPAQDTLPGARNVPVIVDRDALVRAFVTTDQPGTSAAAVTLAHRCGSAGAVAEVALVGPAQVPAATVEGDRATVYERRLDADEICADLQVAVTATASGPDGGRAAARWPVSGFAALATTTPPTTSFVLVPVALNGGAAPSIPNPPAYLADTERMFPLGEGTITNIEVGAALAFSGDLTQGSAWSSLLQAITSVALADPQDRHHIGVVTPPYSSGIAGIAWVGNGPFTPMAAVVWSKSGFAGVTAHELGHNWGRRHAPCGNVGSPDSAYPYAGGSIGVWGYDLASDGLKDPTRFADLMGYCSQSWVSDYTYAGVAAYRDQFGYSVRAASARVPGVLLTGVVDHDTGALTLDPVFALAARPEPVPPGPYLAVGIATDGTVAFRVPFDTREVSRHEVEPFRVFVPWSSAAAPALAALRIERDGVVLVERVAVLRPSAAPAVTAERTPDGRVRLSWSTGAYSWARVSDADDGTLLGLGQGGELLVAPVGPRLRVHLGDGLNSVSVDVAY